jgi:hypothetical protein
MQVPICRHIKSDGLQCRGVALKSSVFCYFHRNLHRSHDLYRDKAHFQSAQMRHDPFLKLPAVEDRASIQLAISSVINALATGCIDEKRAYALLNGLRLASSNARGLRIVRRPTHMVRDVYKESWTPIPEANPDIAPPGRTIDLPDEPGAPHLASEMGDLAGEKSAPSAQPGAPHLASEMWAFAPPTQSATELPQPPPSSPQPPSS